ncbi:MAG: late competence development ComFB family protein [Candidatus Riflebacteria bacterium]|nr:late competence development ComFB family protein [Candidatus Riflebacteria bacterium]
MTLKERDPVFENLENLQEGAVYETLGQILDEEAKRGLIICRCPACLVDIAAVALNSLPPRYVADRFNKFPPENGEIDRHRDQVIQALRLAIRTVSSRPHHR